MCRQWPCLNVYIKHGLILYIYYLYYQHKTMANILSTTVASLMSSYIAIITKSGKCSYMRTILSLNAGFPLFECPLLSPHAVFDKEVSTWIFIHTIFDRRSPSLNSKEYKVRENRMLWLKTQERSGELSGCFETWG